MPFDRAHLNTPSRIMAPVCAVFFAVIGSNFAAGTFGRADASPMLRYANTLMPIPVWGALFIVCALLMVAAMVRGSRMVYRYALLVCSFSMVVWSLVAVAGIFVEPVSYSAWAWPAFVAAVCWSFDKSLSQNMQDRPREN
jgi:hypothetical protein